jgi:hypothetical protein
MACWIAGMLGGPINTKKILAGARIFFLFERAINLSGDFEYCSVANSSGETYFI